MYLPLMFNLVDKEMVIIGGGCVGLRKAIKLLPYGGKLKVVSLSFTEGFQSLENIKLTLAPYEKAHIQGAALVVAATSDGALNAQIYRDCQLEKILCNVVDDPTRSDVIFPASIQKGEITFAVSTSGNSPLLSKKILQIFSDLCDDGFEEKVKLLGEIRKYILKHEMNPKKKQRQLEEIVQWPVEALKVYIQEIKMGESQWK